MCVISPNDQLEQTLTAFDIEEVAGDLIKAVEAHSKVVVLTGINGATSAQLRMAGINANAVRAAMENAIDAYRATCRNCQGLTSGTQADSKDLTDAQDACIERNNRAILSTAMRRVDATEAADAALTARQRARGDVPLETLPAYGTTETAPCADLTRADERFAYGRSGAAADASFAHGAYEQQFRSSVA